MDVQGERSRRHLAATHRNNRALLIDAWASVKTLDTVHSNIPAFFFNSYHAPIKLLLIFHPHGYGVNVQLTPPH